MSAEILLHIDSLVISPARAGEPVVNAVDLHLARGEVLALIGESGSGKTTLALAALGHVRRGLRLASGCVRLEGQALLGAGPSVAGPATLRSLRGRVVSYVAQSAASAFNQRMRLDRQVIEPARVHRAMAGAQALQRARGLYAQLGLPEPERIGARYPHEVSGGQLQRFMIAMGLLLRPSLLVCDEPTSALDVTTQVEVLWALKAAVRDNRSAALFVSHDLAVVAQIADRVAVLRHGCLVECGPTAQVLRAPRQTYTQELIEACRRWPAKALAQPAASVAPKLERTFLELSGVCAGYGTGRGGASQSLAVRDVSMQVGRGQVVAVIGESGSGKSTLARTIAGLHPRAGGLITLQGQALAPALSQRSRSELRRVQIVFQHADTALNPLHPVGRILGRTLDFYATVPASQRLQQVESLLDMVQLPPHYAGRRPDQLSGGEKQRVNLARALAAQPEVLICDEIASALDTIVAGAILELIRSLRDQLKLAVVFISHDVASVSSLADEVVLLHHGQVVEQGPASAVLGAPQTGYGQRLVRSVPQLEPGWLERAWGSQQSTRTEVVT